MKRNLLFKIFVAFLAFVMVFTTVYWVFAAGIDEAEMTASAIMLLDQDTGTVLYEKNPDAKIAPASTTKIMTALVALDHLQLTDEITVGAEVSVSGSLMGLKPGQTVTVETLLYGMFLSSGNDAAVALAVKVAGSTDQFAALMNQKAAEFGMTNTNFVTVSGLDWDGHQTTVRDMAKLAQHAAGNETIMKIAGSKTYNATTVDKTTNFNLENTNRLLYTPENKDPNTPPYTNFEYEYTTGLKTGSTANAGGCVIATAQKDGRHLIALVFGDSSDQGAKRWTIVRSLFEYGFNEFSKVPLDELAAEKLQIDVANAPVVDGVPMKLKCVPAGTGADGAIVLKNDVDRAQITVQITPNEGLAAPVLMGDIVGKVVIANGEQTIFSGDLAAAEDMMSNEEYQKLVENANANKVGPVDLDDPNTEVRKISKYVWLWLLIPIALIVFLVVRTLGAKRSRRMRYSRSRRKKVGSVYRRRRRRF